MKPKNRQRTETDRRSGVHTAYAKTFSTDHGRSVLEDLENLTNLQATGFVPGQADLTAFNLGKKEVILQIKQKITRGLSHA